MKLCDICSGTTRVVSKRYLIILSLSLPLTLLGMEKFSGSIQFAEGRVVEFEHFGTGKSKAPYKIIGKMGQQRVEYPFADVAEIIFPDYKETSYRPDKTGDLIVVSRSGKRFTIEEAYVFPYETIIYHYLDPVTENLERAHSKIFGAITSIRIGEHSGKLKLNPKTGEFFSGLLYFRPLYRRETAMGGPGVSGEMVTEAHASAFFLGPLNNA